MRYIVPQLLKSWLWRGSWEVQESMVVADDILDERREGG
jgi:hypothetical protein